MQKLQNFYKNWNYKEFYKKKNNLINFKTKV